MENYLNTNLVLLRKAKELTQTEMATVLDLKRTTYMNYESGHTEPSIDTVAKIASYFGIKIEDLLKQKLENVQLTDIKDGEENVQLNVQASVQAMSKNETKEPKQDYLIKNDLHIIPTVPKVVTIDSTGDENAVMVPIRARAGYLNGFGDPHFIESLPGFKLPGLRNGSYRIFEVEGLSMFPTLQDKDLVIARWTPLSEIREDRVHVLVTRNHGLLIKRVLSRLNEGVLICKSDHNLKGEYPNIVLEADEVLEVWYSVERMTKHLPSPGEIYKRITDLEADIALIKHKMGKS